jgi:hypothetical protein
MSKKCLDYKAMLNLLTQPMIENVWVLENATSAAATATAATSPTSAEI